MKPDRDEILHAASLFFEPGQVVELRTAKGSQGVVSGYFSDHDKLAEAAYQQSLNPETPAVYWTLQKCEPSLLARSANSVKPWAKTTTADSEIVFYRWLPIDVDPVRPAGISATDEEKAAAGAVAHAVREHLAVRGVSTIFSDSGNGFQLLARVDLPNTNESRALIARVLVSLARQFDTPGAKVDQRVFNPARIWKVYGTVARKGSDMPDRPHRLAKILDAPESLAVVTAATLEAIAGPADSASTDIEPNAAKLEQFLAEARIEHGTRLSYNGGCKWQLKACPFGGHESPDSFVAVRPSGASVFSCSHNSCAEYDWHAFRRYAEERIGKKFNFSDGVCSPLSDLANAKRLVKAASGNLKHCPGLGWMYWTGKQWTAEGADVFLHSLVEPVIAEINREAAASAPEEYRKWAVATANQNRIRAMFALAEPMLSIRADEFDADPWLFNCANGTVDLRTQAFRPHRREDFCTRISPVEYNPQAECPEWEKFTRWAADGDPEMYEFLRAAAGYTLTGSTAEQCLFFAYGLGSNGKSQFFEALLAVMGDYGMSTSFDVLLEREGRSNEYDLAQFRGVRLLCASEPRRGSAFDTAIIKTITGGESLRGRHIYGKPFSYSPQFKVWVAGNTRPEVRGSDEGTWRRFRLLPFENQVAPENRVKDLARNVFIAEELSGILNWALQGLMHYQKLGELPDSERIVNAVREYRAEEDVLSQFFEDQGYTITLSQDDFIPACFLRHAFNSYTDNMGQNRWGVRQFSEALREHGLKPAKRGKDRERVWVGIRGRFARNGHQLAEEPLSERKG